MRASLLIPILLAALSACGPSDDEKEKEQEDASGADDGSYKIIKVGQKKLRLEKGKLLEYRCSEVFTKFLITDSMDSCKPVNLTTSITSLDPFVQEWVYKSSDGSFEMKGTQTGSEGKLTIEGTTYSCAIYDGQTFDGSDDFNLALIQLFMRNGRDKTDDIEDGDIFALGGGADDCEDLY